MCRVARLEGVHRVGALDRRDRVVDDARAPHARPLGVRVARPVGVCVAEKLPQKIHLSSLTALSLGYVRKYFLTDKYTDLFYNFCKKNVSLCLHGSK